MTKKIIVSRAFAKKVRSRFYFTGIPCIRGHTVERYTLTGHCTQCVSDRNARRIRRA